MDADKDPELKLALQGRFVGEGKRLDALDVIRGVAALAVFFHHLFLLNFVQGGWPDWVRYLSALTWYGQFGVDIFFVLSGYLITGILILSRNKQHYYKKFYIKRSFRIFPVYYIVLIILFFAVPTHRDYFALSAIFLGNFYTWLHIADFGPFWTLAIEEHFYLVWPVVARRINIRRTGIIICAGLVFLALAARIISAASGHYNFRPTPFRFDGLALGALLAYAQPYMNRRSLVGVSAVAAVLASAGLALIGEPRLQAIGYSGAAMLGLCLVCAALAWGERPLGRAGRAILFVGKISYAFYLIHIYVLMGTAAFFGPIPPGNFGLALVEIVCALTVTTLTCVIINRLIEIPMLRWRNAVLYKAPGPAKVVAVRPASGS